MAETFQCPSCEKTCCAPQHMGTGFHVDCNGDGYASHSNPPECVPVKPEAAAKAEVKPRVFKCSGCGWECRKQGKHQHSDCSGTKVKGREKHEFSGSDQCEPGFVESPEPKSWFMCSGCGQIHGLGECLVKA